MTTTTSHWQVLEALRLADEISKAGAFPAYPRAPYEAAAAELRRLHAQVAALTAAPGVQPLSDGQIASACMSYRHDFGLLEPDERAKIMFTASEWERAFSKEREWTAPAQPAEGAANVAKPAEIEHVADDVSKNGAELNMAYAELPTRYYLVGGVEKAWDQQQMHAFADRTHALRTPHGQAPAGAAPAGVAVAGPGRKCMGLRCMASAENGYAHSRECIDEVGEAQVWKPTAEDFAKCGPSAPTSPAQTADSVLEDAARYRAFIECGQPICFMGEEYYGKAALDAAIDAARKQGGA